MTAPRDLLGDYREDIQRCMRCGFCRTLCPTWEFVGWETGSPRGRMQLIKALLEGELDANPYLTDRIYKCALCGYCQWRCPPGVKTTDIIKAARAYFVDMNYYPLEMDKVIGCIEENRSIYNVPRKERAFWIELMDLQDLVPLKKEAEVVYFPGCVSSFSGRAMKIAAATSLILDHLRLDWTVLGEEEWCCGNPLTLSGKIRFARELAQHNVGAIRRLGAKVLLTSCAGCYRTFTEEYPKRVNDLGFSFKVQHTVQFLEEMLKHRSVELEVGAAETVAYHDPCELGRPLGIFAPPREVLKRIPDLRFKELPKSKSLTHCCGGGGLLKATNPEIASKLGLKKVEEAKSIGAQSLISACPSCLLNISEAIDRSNSPMRTMDITEAVAKAMGLKV